MAQGQIATQADRTSVRRPRARRIVIDLAIMTVIGVIVAIVGPFGSFDDPLPVRLVGWLLFAYIGYAIYSPMGFLVDRFEVGLDLPRPALWCVAVILATFPMTAAVWAVGYMPGPVALPSFEQFAGIYPYVLVIGGAVTALFYNLRAAKTSSGAPPDKEAPVIEDLATATSEPNPLLDQLPASLGSDVIALEMEDHYVRVHTRLGSELVLMRLRDAMAHLSSIEGKQVHRSWWVARMAVEDVRREGRNVRLVLPSGLEAPVARAQVSELKEADWI